MSKFTKIFLCCVIINAGSNVYRWIAAQMQKFFSYSDHCAPRVLSSIYALKFLSIMWQSIGGILGRRAYSQVLFSVIQAVVISVIYKFLAVVPEYESVHKHAFSTCKRMARMELTMDFAPSSKPSQSGNSLEVFGVDNCNLSLRKWNKAVWFVKRLDYFKSILKCWHGLTLNEIVLVQPFISLESGLL